MILQGSQRGGDGNLAAHLLKEENDHVHVHDLRGFVSDDLHGAFKEAYAASRATKAKQFLFSLSLNPPPNEAVPTEIFEQAIERVEQKLGLSHQPRAIVFHEKEGRRHAHAVWSRIDAKEDKAVQLSFTKRKLMDISRELFLEQGWRMPKGLMSSELRDPRNFTLAQWQQAQRNDIDPRQIKLVIQECWATSDTQRSFGHALFERGFILARGDRRGFVAVDFLGEVYSIAKWTNQKTLLVKEKLESPNDLPSVSEAKSLWQKQHADRLNELLARHKETVRSRFALIKSKKEQCIKSHKAARFALEQKQNSQKRALSAKHKSGIRQGFLGLFDRISGARKRLEIKIEADTYRLAKQHQIQRDELIFSQLEEKRMLISRGERLRAYTREQQKRYALEREELHKRFSQQDVHKPGPKRSNDLQR